MGLTLRLKLCVAVYILRSVAVAVKLLEEFVPLLLCYRDANLGKCVHIEYPVQLSGSPRRIGVVVVDRGLGRRLILAAIILAILFSVILTILLIILIATLGFLGVGTLGKDKLVILDARYGEHA